MNVNESNPDRGPQPNPHPDPNVEAQRLLQAAGCLLPSRLWQVALGIDAPSADEEAHLATCARCQHYRDQVQNEVGARAEAAAAAQVNRLRNDYVLPPRKGA